MQALYAEALKAGGIAFTFVHMSREEYIVMSNGNIQQIEPPDPMLHLMYETCDAIVRIEADEDTKALGSFSTEISQARQRARADCLSIQMRREAPNSLPRSTTLAPTPSD